MLKKLTVKEASDQREFAERTAHRCWKDCKRECKLSVDALVWIFEFLF